MQVAATRTPSTAPSVAAAAIEAYTRLKKRPPPTKSSWLWPLALSANETRSWAAMYNWNAGNVTTTGNGTNWFAIPGVENFKYLAFPDLVAGVTSMLKVMDKFGGLDAADRSDQAGWQAALDKYLGSPYPPPWKLVAQFDTVEPESGWHTHPSPSQPQHGAPSFLVALAAFGLAGAAGYAAYRRRELFS